MDSSQIDGISAVLGALAASAGAGVGAAVEDATKSTITAGTDKLLALVRSRLKDDPVGDAKLTVYAAEPTPGNGQALHGHLVDAGINHDQDVVTLARELLAGAGPAALAPGSVAASVITQVNTHGGTGFIGGQHLHHHGAPPTRRVAWDLLRLDGDGYELRNSGTATAADVTVDANVDLAWPSPPDPNIPDGSSVMFMCAPSLADPSPVVTVTWSAMDSPTRHRWQRPLPR